MFDEISFLFFVGSVILYASLLFYRFRSKKPFKLTLYNMIYQDWVKNRMNKNEIATVQYLRNFQVGNSTLISALFVLLGILLGLYNSSFLDSTPFFGSEEITLGLVKIALNAGIIIFSILNFILSLRSITRLSILISGNPENYKLDEVNGLDETKKAFITAKNHWMVGIRSLFYLTASLIWFINPVIFMSLTAIITIYLILLRDIRAVRKKK
ncbi:MAG: DUF599 family protein [Candidatus Lokiarchaeota archaeon]|nr:DUF599 family protein [Candidatus Lokiarchaeota archaeon]MBD3200636.1 DUF599 family protein [Candidatus Lokiarchaeota archaeon]